MTPEKSRLSAPPAGPQHTRTGLSAEILTRAIHDNLCFVLGRHPSIATDYEWFRAVALAAPLVRSVESSIRAWTAFVSTLTAIAAPRPEVPPLTSTTRSVRSGIILLSLGVHYTGPRRRLR